MPLVQLKNISKQYVIQRQHLYAVQDVSLSIFQHEILGLAGESGCGKSTIAKMMLGLVKPTSGTLLFDESELRKPHPKEIQMVFQNPSGALNPRMTIEEILSEPFEIHRIAGKREKIIHLLEQVGLSSGYLDRLPQELSGGQKQRINIARALALEPRLLICDEPLAALDATIQKQVISVLKDVQTKKGLTYLFISHDLSTMKQMTDRIAIMYLGHLVEIGPTSEIFREPLHPYTKALISAIPKADPREEKKRLRIILKGDLPSPFKLEKGCVFHSRCPFATDICREQKPTLKQISLQHSVACHHITA